MSNLHLDTSLEKARALHRVWRALNDGDCPKCHKHHPATAMDRETINGIACPSCGFYVSDQEIEDIETMFAPAMDAAVAIFEEWRQTQTIPKRREGHIRISEEPDGPGYYATDIHIKRGETVNVREVFPGDPPPQILDAIVKLHEDKDIGQHWLITALERIAEGEAEIDVMRDYRYLYEKHKDATVMKLAKEMKNHAWLLRMREGDMKGSDFYAKSIASHVDELLNAILSQSSDNPPSLIEPTQEQIDSACLSYRHDFGLLGIVAKEDVRSSAREWLRAWQKEGLV